MARKTRYMKVYYDPAFYLKLKKLDVRIRKRLKDRILIFSENPNDPILNNHILKREYEGHRSIDITSNYRAIYYEEELKNEIVANFVFIGTHDQLYLPKN